MTAPTGSQPPPGSPGALFEAQPRPDGSANLRGLLPSLLLNAAAPYVAYQVLTGRGVSETNALTISAVFPVIGIGAGFVRTRRADIIGVVSLVFIAVGVLTSLVSGDPRFILIKESLLTGVFGLVCLVSLLLPRPLMFYFGRQFTAAGDPARAAAYDSLWQYAGFRRINRNITILWGIGLLCEALIRVALTFVLPIPLFLIVSPVLGFGATFGLIALTIGYARRAGRRAAERARLEPRPTTLP